MQKIYNRFKKKTNDGIREFVTVKCRFCEKFFDVNSKNYKRAINNQGFYRCKKCYAERLGIDYTHYKGTPIHNSFAGAKQRCNYKKHIQYKDYGGRGVKFLWESFIDFYNDMGDAWFDGATLERVDVDGDYCKENCIWIVGAKQARNTRKNIHTEEDIKLIRNLYKLGWYNQNSLALLFKDSQGNISNIITNKVWKL